MNTLLFETIKCNDFEVFNLSYHKKRISNTIGFNFNLEEYIYPPNEHLLKCKLIYDSNGVIDIEYSTYTKREISSFKIIYDNTIEYNKKMLNRESLVNLYNQKGSCDEIFIFKNGFLTDTSIANVAIYYNGKWITPKKPLLYGTTRARYLEEEFLFEENITLEMLQSSKQIALLNAMIDFDIIENFRIEG